MRPMEKQDIPAKLREHAALKAQGVSHAHFSARARGDARSDSDIDILVEIAPEIRMDVFRYVGIVHSIEYLLDQGVGTRDLIRPVLG